MRDSLLSLIVDSCQGFEARNSFERRGCGFASKCGCVLTVQGSRLPIRLSTEASTEEGWLCLHALAKQILGGALPKQSLLDDEVRSGLIG